MLRSRPGARVVRASLLAAMVAGMVSTTGHLTATATDEPESSPLRSVTLAFGGDVHGENPISRTLAAGRNPFGAAVPYLTSADIAVVNLETAVSSRGAPREKQYTFRTGTPLLKAITASGVDVVSVANNHAFDFGALAFADTLRSIQRVGLLSVGGGSNADEAYQAAVVTRNGVRIAFVGIASVNGGPGAVATSTRPGTTDGWNTRAATAAVARAAMDADVVVVLAHWGAENTHCPRASEISAAAAWRRAGADIIVGGHPHVLQAVVTTDHHLTAYSLGNFVFYANRADAVRTGVLDVSLTVDEKGVVRFPSVAFHPLRIDPKTGSLRATTAAESRRDLADLAGYLRDSSCQGTR